MNRSQPLDRLLRAAARAPAPALAPASARSEDSVLREWRHAKAAPATDLDDAGLLPVYRRGLALACGLMVLALSLTLVQVRRPGNPPWTTTATAVALVYSR